MSEALLAAALAAAAIWFVLRPLRGSRDAAAPSEALRAELEAAKDSKYQEIRDAELDLATGKLSVQDHRELDRALRAEAIEILRKLDEL